MKYNFDEIIDRRGTNSIKWDMAADDVLPMWVADMDFKTAPAIAKALTRRLGHGIFGYTQPSKAYYDAIIQWWGRRHNLIVQKNWILSATGVIPALSAIIKALTVAGDKVIVQSPVYNHFFTLVDNSQCDLVCNELLYQDGVYTIDFADLDRKVSDRKVKLLLLCNPHNPVGRVWTRDELIQIGAICLKNNVIVISDEIHCDLVYAGSTHIPIASLGDKFLANCVTCSAPSKTFNLAGLQAGYVITANAEIRKSIEKELNTNEVGTISPFAIEALIAAYTDGEEWLEAVQHYIYDNYVYLKDFFAQHLPQFKVVPLQATYLVWIDCSVLKEPSAKITAGLLSRQKLWVNPGTMYGEAGEGFIRVNIACPRQLLTEGLNKFKNYFENY